MAGKRWTQSDADFAWARRLVAKATARADAGMGRLRFDAQAALALARRHGRHGAARRLLVTLGHLSDALECGDAEPPPPLTPSRSLTQSQTLSDLATPTSADACGAEAVLAAAPPEQQRPLWLQVLRREIAAPGAGGAGTPDAAARIQAGEALVQRSGGVLQTEDLLPLLPEVAGSAADAGALLRRACAAERAHAVGLSQGLDGMEGRTQRRRRALARVQAHSGGAAEHSLPRRRKCGVCGRELAAAPGGGAVCGAHWPGSLRPPCAGVGVPVTAAWPKRTRFRMCCTSSRSWCCAWWGEAAVARRLAPQ